jgi:hypothetical protein
MGIPILGGLVNFVTETAGVVCDIAEETTRDVSTGATELVTDTAKTVSDVAAPIVEVGGKAIKEAKAGVEEVLAIGRSLSTAPEDAHDPAKLTERFLAALPKVRPLVDAKADAISIGYLGELGAGLMVAKGTEVLYIRAKDDQPARMRVSHVSGAFGRIQAGGGARAYFRCMYGDANAIAKTTERNGAEVGLVVASVGFFRGEAPDGQGVVRGWTGALGAGAGVGIPLLSDSAAFRLNEEPVATVALTAEQAQAIEQALADPKSAAPDRSWLRNVATAL